MPLVCPAGNLPALKAAIDAGADAVYAGFRDQTNARAFPGLNFDEAELREGIGHAHAHGRKVYLALNTYPETARLPVWRRCVTCTNASASAGRCCRACCRCSRSSACALARRCRWKCSRSAACASWSKAAASCRATSPAHRRTGTASARRPLLVEDGLHRWVPGVEQGHALIAGLLDAVAADGGTRPELEVIAWGRLPLAYSARCFTARALDVAGGPGKPGLPAA